MPSAARNMGGAGTIKAVRQFFSEMDLRSIKARSETSFIIKLDKTTDQLIKCLPEDAKSWGSSRKFLNIYLRNCLYNRYICDYYQLDNLEGWLEVPLDSHVGKGLKLTKEGGNLPRWRTVVGLTPEESKEFQKVANLVAISKGVARVHLDILYHRGTHIQNSTCFSK